MNTIAICPQGSRMCPQCNVLTQQKCSTVWLPLTRQSDTDTFWLAFTFICKLKSIQFRSIDHKAIFQWAYLFQALSLLTFCFSFGSVVFALKNYGLIFWILVQTSFCDREIQRCHSRRECKIFACGVNFSRNNAVCYINESKKLHFTLISSQKLLTYY